MTWVLAISACSGPLPPSPPDPPDPPPSAREALRMAYTRDRDTPEGEWMFCVFSEVFERIGVDMVFEDFSPKRATLMAERGEVDGELGRVGAYGEGRPMLVRVDEPLTTVRWIAFVVDPSIDIQGWDDLAAYRVDVRRGLDRAERLLVDILPAGQLDTVDDAKQGLAKLASGRTQVYVDVEEGRELLLLDPRYPTVRKVSLGEEKLYAYLHERHAALAPRVAEALSELHGAGMFETCSQLSRHARPTGSHLSNGSFEASELQAWTPVDGAVLRLDAEEYYAGARALRMDLEPGEDATVRPRAVQRVRVAPGDNFTLRAQLRLAEPGPFASVDVQFVDAGGREVFTNALAVVSDPGTWVSRSAWVKAPPGAVEAHVRWLAAGSGTLWLDDVALNLEPPVY